MIKTVFGVTLALVLSVGAAFAHDYDVGDLSIDHPWARASAGKAPNGAAYMTLSNAGDSADFLVKAASPVAKMVELHTVSDVDGVMQMRAVEKVQVAPGEPTVFQPGGLHIMLMGLEAPLVEGTSFPMTLTFQNAGDVDVQVKVESVGAMGSMGTDASPHGDHGGMGH